MGQSGKSLPHKYTMLWGRHTDDGLKIWFAYFSLSHFSGRKRPQITFSHPFLCRKKIVIVTYRTDTYVVFTVRYEQLITSTFSHKNSISIFSGFLCLFAHHSPFGNGIKFWCQPIWKPISISKSSLCHQT